MPIPNWVLRTISLPYGARLPQAEEPPKAQNYTQFGGYSYSGLWQGRRSSKVQSYMDFEQDEPRGLEHGKVMAGNLLPHEYEFFAGSYYDASGFSVCRWCTATFYHGDRRKEHTRETECSQLIKKVGKLLCKDMKCVCCDKQTHQKSWGVPLCSPVCVARFKFRSGLGTSAYEAAKDLVEKSLKA